MARERKVVFYVGVGSGPYGPRPFDNEPDARAYYEHEISIPSGIGPGRRRGSLVKVTTLTEVLAS